MANPIKVCLCISGDCISIIAGENGLTLKKYSEDSQCLISVQSAEDTQSGSNERILIFEGESNNVVKALKLVIPQIAGRKSINLDSLWPTDSESVKTVIWLVPQKLCGYVIGKGGHYIKKIETTSGALVQLLPESIEKLEERFAPV
jgi:hypothetical protein